MLQIFNRKKGFTLIELLVVIAIIGTLASIVLVSMGSARSSARDATRKADMRQIVSAQELFYNKNSRFYTCNGVGADCGALTWPASIVDPGANPTTWMARVPTDPGSNVYTWVDNTGDSQKFCAWVLLEGTGWYISSHAGNLTKTSAAPTTLDSCTTI